MNFKRKCKNRENDRFYVQNTKISKKWRIFKTQFLLEGELYSCEMRAPTFKRDDDRSIVRIVDDHSSSDGHQQLCAVRLERQVVNARAIVMRDVYITTRSKCQNKKSTYAFPFSVFRFFSFDFRLSLFHDSQEF